MIFPSHTPTTGPEPGSNHTAPSCVPGYRVKKGDTNG